MPYTLIRNQRLASQFNLSGGATINFKQLLEQTMPVSLTADKILQALREARYLTISQIAQMFYSKRKDGLVPSVITRRPREGEVYEPVPGFDSAYDQVRRMARRDEVKIVPYTIQGRPIPQMKRLVMFPKDTLSHQKWEHEIARGDCYVALHRTGKLTGYRSQWSKDEREVFGKEHGVYFDSQFELEGSKLTFFLEVDMGTEYWDNELNTKVEDYAGLAQSMPQYPFYAVFVAKTRPGTDRKERLKAFGECFRKYGRGQNFVVTDLELFIDNPLGKIFAANRLTAPASLLELP